MDIIQHTAEIKLEYIKKGTVEMTRKREKQKLDNMWCVLPYVAVHLYTYKK